MAYHIKRSPALALISLILALIYSFVTEYQNSSEQTSAPYRVGPKSYYEARRILKELYPGPAKTFYCGCRYDAKRQVDARRCGLPRDLSNSERSQRVEWEHIVPASIYGRTFLAWNGHPQCGKTKGRSCARKVSKEFSHMEANLYNLKPSVGSINSLRGNRTMTDLPGDQYKGQCHFETESGKVEPKDSIKGNIARIYFYMNKAYPNRNIIEPENRDNYLLWDVLDPVDADECALARDIEQLQGHQNGIVESRCKQAGL